jgi:hypothetical protein
MDRDRELDVWEERFRLGGVPSPAELEKELSAKATTCARISSDRRRQEFYSCLFFCASCELSAKH